MFQKKKTAVDINLGIFWHIKPNFTCWFLTLLIFTRDTVDHQILLDKMQLFGITGHAHGNFDIGVQHGSCLGPLSELFLRLFEVHPRNLRNSKTDIAIFLLRTGNGQKSFAYRGASLWSSLDLDTKMAPSINAFKFKLKEK